MEEKEIVRARIGIIKGFPIIMFAIAIYVFWFGLQGSLEEGIGFGLPLALLGVYSLLVRMFNSLTVTNMRVYGRMILGRRIDLPLDSISSVGTSLFWGISIATSSGVIRYRLIGNRNEVFSSISNLLMERQRKNQEDKSRENSSVNTIAKQNSILALKEYKELLDSGVISQEEFDAKKKQILGL